MPYGSRTSPAQHFRSVAATAPDDTDPLEQIGRSMSSEILRSRSARQYLEVAPSTATVGTVLSVVAQTLSFPTARINILDEHTQHTIGIHGPGAPDSVDRRESFCDVVVTSGNPLIVHDAARDARFSACSAVLDGQIRSYLGLPLRGRESLLIGAVCVHDDEPRTIGPQQLSLLIQFGRIIERQLEVRRRMTEQRAGRRAAS